MGLILDIVPNHMGVGGADNAWWLDVLEWGRASPYAEFFDIDWDPPDADAARPAAGAVPGQRRTATCWRTGELRAAIRRDGRAAVRRLSRRTVSRSRPRDYAAVLLTGGGPLEAPARLFAELGAGGRGACARAAEAAREELLQPAYAAARSPKRCAAYDADDAGRAATGCTACWSGRHYRLAWWRAATDEINWRRFFDVNGLAGVRVGAAGGVRGHPRAPCSACTREGLIDGVRIDHVDGLADPRDYCRKLRRRLDALHAEARRRVCADEPAILWIEKILFAHERLADRLADRRHHRLRLHERRRRRAARSGRRGAADRSCGPALTGRPGDFEDEAAAGAAADPAREPVAANCSRPPPRCTASPGAICATRDYTLTGDPPRADGAAGAFPHLSHLCRPGRHLRNRPAGDGLGDGRRAAHRARRRPPTAGPGRRAGSPATACATCRRARGGRNGCARWCASSSFRAPTAAKSVEDTAFYRYGRLLSRNEVGSEPSQFALTPGRLPRRRPRAAAPLAARAAGHRDARPQARRGYPRAPRRAERDARRVGSRAAALDAAERAAEARGGRPRRRTPPTR